MTGTWPGEDLLRTLAPQVLAALVRRHGAFDLCEDAVQETLLEASIKWLERGVPESPRAWLATVATRRFIDRVRSDRSRRLREERLTFGAPPAEVLHAAEGIAHDGNGDDSLVLLLLCCHPSLTPPSQIALTLRAVGGVRTEEIAHAFF
ncbi:MAG: sigma factor, partial [Acidimicrobiales bacterium]